MLRFVTLIQQYVSALGKFHVFLGLLFCMGLVSTLLSILLLFQSSTASSIIQVQDLSSSVSNQPIQEVQVFIDIGGAVNRPGVYQFGSLPRLGEVVERAGGLQINADPAFISEQMNLSRKLSDESKIFIPFIGSPGSDELKVNSEGPQAGSKVSLNTASQKELESLPGIGEKRAQEIVQSRPFTTIEELQRKVGLSLKVFNEIKELVEI